MRRLDTYVCAVNKNSLVPFHPADPEYKAQKLETVSESESEDDDPPKLALARRRAIAAPAVTPFGVLPDEYIVDRLLVVRPGRRLLEYLVHWVGYGAWGDTWEPEHHLPEAEVAAFRATLPISVDLQLPIRFFREPIARRLSSRKSAERRPAHKLVLEVEPLKVPELALAVLEYLSKLCSPPVPIIHEALGSDLECWTLYVPPRTLDTLGHFGTLWDTLRHFVGRGSGVAPFHM